MFLVAACVYYTVECGEICDYISVRYFMFIVPYHCIFHDWMIMVCQNIALEIP